jgi:hypothetical protein
MAVDKTSPSLARYIHKASWALRNIRPARSSICLVDVLLAEAFTAEAVRHGDSWHDRRRLHSMLLVPKIQRLRL